MGLLREVELLADIAAYRQENERLHSEIERLRAEVLAEREACARIAEEWYVRRVADDIRARGEKP